MTRGHPPPRRAAALLALLIGAALPAAAVAADLSADAVFAREHVLRTRDHRGAPFALIDKRLAHLWLFDGQGRSLGETPVLLGSAIGDDSAPGIGERPLAQVLPQERTTPAGRFQSERGRSSTRGEDVLWIDYDAAVSLHRVVTTQPSERRVQRLASKRSDDNRISYGCINVPTVFYDGALALAVATAAPVVYVLPETRPVQTLFRARGQARGPS